MKSELVETIKRKITWLNIINTFFIIIISIIIFAVIMIFSTESIKYKDQLLINYQDKLETNNMVINNLQSQINFFNNSKFSLSDINFRKIDSEFFKSIDELKNDKKLLNKSIPDIITNKDLFDYMATKYATLHYIAGTHEDIQKRIEAYNKEYAFKYGEYFSKDFDDLKYWGYTDYDGSESNQFELYFVRGIYDSYNYGSKVQSNYFQKEMNKFNLFIDDKLDKSDKELKSILSDSIIINDRINQEIKHLEQPNVFLITAIISRVIIIIFLLFLIQILLTTFRYLLKLKSKYDDQIALILFLNESNIKDSNILNLLVSEKINLDSVPEPLLKELLQSIKLK